MAGSQLAKTKEELIADKGNQLGKINEHADSHPKIRVRLIPIWLRLIVVAVLLALSIIIGAVIGYSVLGNGKAVDTFNNETWTHIFDLVNKK